MRNLLQRSQTLVTHSQDKLQEDSHVEEALHACGYPEWSFTKVKRQVKSRAIKKNNRKKHQEGSSKWLVIVIPYIESLLNHCKDHEEVQCTCGNETLENIKGITGTP